MSPDGPGLRSDFAGDGFDRRPCLCRGSAADMRDVMGSLSRSTPAAEARPVPHPDSQRFSPHLGCPARGRPSLPAPWLLLTSPISEMRGLIPLMPTAQRAGQLELEIKHPLKSFFLRSTPQCNLSCAIKGVARNTQFKKKNLVLGDLPCRSSQREPRSLLSKAELWIAVLLHFFFFYL